MFSFCEDMLKLKYSNVDFKIFLGIIHHFNEGKKGKVKMAFHPHSVTTPVCICVANMNKYNNSR